MKCINALSIAVQAGIPVILWGAPGIGKTSAINKMAADYGMTLETVIASIREPSDFSGLPVVGEGDSVSFAPPKWAKTLAESKNPLLFLDEISTAPPAVQAALLRVVFDRVVGDLSLPDNLKIIAAANPPDQAAGGWELSPPLANRFLHLDCVPDYDDWATGMESGKWPSAKTARIDEKWRDNLPEARVLVAAFIRTRPGLMISVPDKAEDAGRAWPSCRSWDMLATLWAAGKSAALGKAEREKVLLDLCEGSVGQGAAIEFRTWVKELDLPDPEHLLANPEKFKMPERGDHRYVVLTSVVQAALRDLNVDRWNAAWKILDSANKQGGVDVAAAAAKSLAAAYTNNTNLPIRSKEIAGFVPLIKAAKEVKLGER